jgi:Tol biopolymer transport system component
MCYFSRETAITILSVAFLSQSGCQQEGVPIEIFSRPSFLSNGSVLAVARYNGQTQLCVIHPTRNEIMALGVANPGDSWPAVSRDDHTVIFSRIVDESTNRSQLWKREADSDTQFINSTQSDSMPCFLPGGRGVVFARAQTLRTTSTGGSRWSDWDLWLAQADGTSEQKLTNFRSFLLSAPSVNPNGNELIFSDDESFYILDLKSNDPPRALAIQFAPDASARTNLISRSPSFSPDGKRIVFYSNAGSASGVYAFEIFTMNTDGSDVRQVTRFGSRNLAPVFSPDGKAILFIEELDTAQAKLHQVDIDGQNSRQLCVLYE